MWRMTVIYYCGEVSDMLLFVSLFLFLTYGRAGQLPLSGAPQNPLRTSLRPVSVYRYRYASLNDGDTF
jgi:hypothetical protein